MRQLFTPSGRVADEGEGVAVGCPVGDVHRPLPAREFQHAAAVAAVGVSTKSFLSAPDLGVAMAAGRDGLRLRARELGADMVAGCQFQVNFGPSAANVTGFGTAIRTS